MKPRSKLRTFCRWMLTILTVMLVVVWIGSGPLPLRAVISLPASEWVHKVRVELDHGTVKIHTSGRQTSTGSEFIDWFWYVDANGTLGLDLWNWTFEKHGRFASMAFPTWALVVLFAIPATLMWRPHIIAHRRKPGMCKKCGYDITGLVGKEACPECGTGFEVEVAQTNAS